MTFKYITKEIMKHVPVRVLARVGYLQLSSNIITAWQEMIMHRRRTCREKTSSFSSVSTLFPLLSLLKYYFILSRLDYDVPSFTETIMLLCVRFLNFNTILGLVRQPNTPGEKQDETLYIIHN
jgi:hypothetical protein